MCVHLSRPATCFLMKKKRMMEERTGTACGGFVVSSYDHYLAVMRDMRGVKNNGGRESEPWVTGGAWRLME